MIEAGSSVSLSPEEIAAARRRFVSTGDLPISFHPDWHLGGPKILIRGEAKMFTYVKLHQDGKQVAISTNAAEEHEFIRGVSESLLKLNGALSTGELEAFLPQVVDICCRMRGYKNTVDERRVLIAGRITPTEESVIAASTPEASKPDATVALAKS